MAYALPWIGVAGFMAFIYLLGRPEKPKPQPEPEYGPDSESYLHRAFWLEGVTHTHDEVMETLRLDIQEAIRKALNEAEEAERWPNGLPGRRVHLEGDDL
ncbi:MAG: hypothetical protein JWO98_2259 [Frankiales bacterium]|nr:hypothetical protein [Frankiales bacterium]